MRDLLNAFDNVEMLSATTAEAGLELARSARPELIIMDINLPQMNGIEALELLRANPDTARIPVIALSAAASPVDKQRGRQVGFDAYMTKPVNVDELITVIERLTASTPSSAPTSAQSEHEAS
jgi:CheY-like chemotaxis protein